jgi:hypothetical protein
VNVDLDAAEEIVHSSAIQVGRRGVQRLPTLQESLALALGALGTLNRSSGVRTMNAEVNGRSVALAVLENMTFGKDENGFTTLKTD